MNKKIINLNRIFEIEYNQRHNILFIRQELTIPELLGIKKYIKDNNIELGDIRVGKFI